MDIGTAARGVSVYALPVLFAVILHEVAHGWVAEKFGDSTARRAGRLNLNPLPHIDPIGTVLLPIIQIAILGRFFIGWAKPVPVNFAALRNPKKNMIWVAFAGPGTNLTLAFISGIAIRLIGQIFPNIIKALFVSVNSPGSVSEFGAVYMVLVPVYLMLCAAVFVNVALMILNLIPVPPLDGGRIAVGLLPYRAAAAYSKVEPFGFFILIIMLFVLTPTRMIFTYAIMIFLYFFSNLAGVEVTEALRVAGLL